MLLGNTGIKPFLSEICQSAGGMEDHTEVIGLILPPGKGLERTRAPDIVIRDGLWSKVLVAPLEIKQHDKASSSPGPLLWPVSCLVCLLEQLPSLCLWGRGEGGQGGGDIVISEF